MKEKKTSFLLYNSFYDSTKHLSLEHKGMLYDAIFLYQNEGIEPEIDSPIYTAFAFIRTQFLMDAEKYEKVVQRNQSNGKKGGRPKTVQDYTQEAIEKPKKPSGFSGNPNEPKKADDEDDNDNDIKKKILKEKYPYKKLREFEENKTAIVDRIVKLGYQKGIVENYFQRLVSYCKTNSNAKKYLDLEACVIAWMNRDNINPQRVRITAKTSDLEKADLEYVKFTKDFMDRTFQGNWHVTQIPLQINRINAQFRKKYPDYAKILLLFDK